MLEGSQAWDCFFRMFTMFPIFSTAGGLEGWFRDAGSQARRHASELRLF